MRNEYLAKAHKTVEQRRIASEITRADRIAAVCEQIPAVAAVRAELAQTSVSLSKMILSHPRDIEKGIEALKASNLALQQKERDLLMAAGYPADYLELHPVCRICNDTGYHDGVRCSCVDLLVKKYSMEALNGVSSMALSDFDSFDLSYYSTERDPATGEVPHRVMSDILAFCRRYAAEFTGTSKGILMMGETGLGKTHLSLAIAKQVTASGYEALYGSATDFLRTVEAEHFGRTEHNGTLERLLETDLLILDDLGAEFTSPFSLSVLYNLINTRINRGKPTIISTNLSVKEIMERYEPRLTSRLFSLFTPLRFLGKDIRQIKTMVK